MKIEYLTLENNEPAVQLRASDPSSNDAILAYLRKIVEGDGTEEQVHDAVQALFRFKEWQAEHSVENAKEDQDVILRQRIVAWLEQKDGFCCRTEMLRKYHLTSKRFDQIVAQLDVHVFMIATGGKPMTYYVLPCRLDRFQEYATTHGWSFLELHGG